MWTKIKLIDFFQKNYKKKITIEKLDRSLVIQGNIIKIEELDLCSHSLFEVKLIQKPSNNEVYITLHDDFLGINIKLLTKKFNNDNNNTLDQISYENLIISGKNEFVIQ